MTGLLIVAGGIGGAVVGGFGGLVAAMLWADMDIASLDGVAYVLGGVGIGAVAGVFVVAELVA